MSVVWVRKSVMAVAVFWISISNSFSQLPELEQQRKIQLQEIDNVLPLVEVGSPSSFGYILSLARNYYRLSNYAMAEEFYLEVIDQPICGTLDYKALALSLRQNGKYSLANEFFNIYKRETGDSSYDALWEIPLQAQTSYERSRETQLTHFDVLYGHVSQNGSTSLNIDHGTVSAQLNCDALTDMSAVMLPVDEFSAVGSFSPGPEEGTYFYSYRGSNGFYGLYYSYTKNNGKVKTYMLQAGEDEVNYIHPMFVNNTLYFSSDKSGGYGGFDLYRADWDGKILTQIENLGPRINSDKNEILPSNFRDGFSFCSNGLPGQGGYDVFYCDWSFSKISTLEWPFNTTQNEFLLVDRKENTAAIVMEVAKSTNLYRVEKYYDFQRKVSGLVNDHAGKPLHDAKVLFSNSGDSKGMYATTNADGEFNLIVNDTIKRWTVQGIKQGFVPSSLELDLKTLGQNPLVVVMKREDPIEPEPVYIVSSRSKNVIPASPEAADSTAPADSLDENQIFNELQSEGAYYIIYASSRTYKGAYDFWNEWQESFPTSEILHSEEAGVFRVGTFAGTTQVEAMKAYRKAKRIKVDAWILRPDQQ